MLDDTVTQRQWRRRHGGRELYGRQHAKAGSSNFKISRKGRCEKRKRPVVVYRVLDEDGSQPAYFWPQATKKKPRKGDVKMQNRGIERPLAFRLEHRHQNKKNSSLLEKIKKTAPPEKKTGFFWR
jgi:hypothetical protein